jgi:hypothetical protein
MGSFQIRLDIEHGSTKFEWTQQVWKLMGLLKTITQTVRRALSLHHELRWKPLSFCGLPQNLSGSVLKIERFSIKTKAIYHRKMVFGRFHQFTDQFLSVFGFQSLVPTIWGLSQSKTDSSMPIYVATTTWYIWRISEQATDLTSTN